METRSTRKFLIKHHPYLQHSVSSTGKNLSQRPSINLMKKLNSKSSVNENPAHENTEFTHTTNPSSNNRSGRSSRSNNSGLNETNNNNNSTSDHNLLKFTDSLPSTGSSATLKRRQLKSLTTASALCSEINQSKRQTTRSRAVNKSLSRQASEANDSGAGEEQCYCEYDENEEGQQVHEDSCGGYCCDEQEEDSSGYYSSYHSVDLVSSSGGSCVGGSQALNRELKTGRNEFGFLS